MKDDYRFTFLEDKETSYVKVGRGTLHRIVVGTTNTTNAVAIWDGVDGGASNAQLGELKTNISEGSYEFNCNFAKGLYIGNPGGSKLTVVWR